MYGCTYTRWAHIQWVHTVTHSHGTHIRCIHTYAVYTHAVHTHTAHTHGAMRLLISSHLGCFTSRRVPWGGATLVPARRPQQPPSRAPKGRPHLPPRRKERLASCGPRSGGGPHRPPPGRHTAAGHSTVPVEVNGARRVHTRFKVRTKRKHTVLGVHLETNRLTFECDNESTGVNP